MPRAARNNRKLLSELHGADVIRNPVAVRNAGEVRKLLGGTHQEYTGRNVEARCFDDEAGVEFLDNWWAEGQRRYWTIVNLKDGRFVRLPSQDPMNPIHRIQKAKIPRGFAVVERRHGRFPREGVVVHGHWLDLKGVKNGEHTTIEGLLEGGKSQEFQAVDAEGPLKNRAHLNEILKSVGIDPQ